MSNNNYKTDFEALSLYKISLYNAVQQTEIQSLLDEVGYGTEKIAEGNSMLNKTQKIYENNITEDNETTASLHDFHTKRDQLEKRYSVDRKKAKVLFRDDPVRIEELKLNGSIPKAYSTWMDTVKTFYVKATEDEAIQAKLATLKLTFEKLEEGLNAVLDVEFTRANYMREKGESQDATNEKDKAFEELDQWMRDFYTVAKIALEEKPQLLESLGKVVKN